MGTKPIFTNIAEERYTPPNTTAVFATGNGAQATVTVAAGVTGQRRVLRSVYFDCIANSTSGGILVAGTVGCYVIDGASGGTAYLFKAVAFIGSTGIARVSAENLDVPGSAATGLTAEFSGAVTNGLEQIEMNYYNIGPSA